MDRCPAVLLQTVRKDLEAAFPNNLADLDENPESLTNSNVAAASALLSSLCKKYEPSEKSVLKRTRSVAIDGFLSCNDLCSRWDPPAHPLFSYVLDEMAYRAARELPELRWNDIFHRSRTGPGASVYSGGKNSALEKLFLNRLSTTSVGLYNAYRRYVAVYPMLKAAELRRQEIQGCAYEVVDGSLLSTVPKNDRTDRTICTEPSLNMFAQLGLGELFNDVLSESYGYSPALQPDRNREHACRGSVAGDLCTIDLKSASDLISWKLIQYVLPDNWVAAIDDLRSPRTTVDGKQVELHMVSSMGNGFTFPLQTYIFSLAIRSLCKILEVKWSRYDNRTTAFGVFGDDIIVPTTIYDTTLALLSWLGFIPNQEKSYGSGPFRESCGSDWHSGVNIRGVYIRSLRTRSDLYSAINRLNMWSARHLIPLPRTIRYLLPRGWKHHLIPTDESIDSGVMVPLALANTVTVYRCLEIEDRKVRLFRKNGRLRWQYDNPIGVMLSTINGSVRMGCISRRQREKHFNEVERTTPYWARHVDLIKHGVGYADWEVLTSLNLKTVQ